jgi:uncharacterized SAM-binding protein YcdF (DUF218 family)
MVKKVWFLIKPGNALLILLVAGTIMLFGRWRHLGQKLIILVVAILVCLAVFPLGTWSLVPLENRFPFPETLPEHIDGIIVLGGAFDQKLILARRQLILGDSGERIFTLLHLARRFPKARIVYAGGENSLGSKGLGDAVSAKSFFSAMGVDFRRVVLESTARNTYENAVFTRQLINPVRGQQWVLVTSAWHIPRAVGVFRKAGWPVIPYPVDFRTQGAYKIQLGFNLVGELERLELGVQEWTALVHYRLRDWCDEWFPASDAAAYHDSH